MMNKDNASNDSAAESRRISMEIMDTSDEQKPSAKEFPISSGKQPPSFVVSAADPNQQPSTAKRKRKSPEKPWKKPADMPKRPLSAYNIFFKDERERLLGAGSEGKGAESGVVGSKDEKSGEGKKGKKRSGIGFANLAKTIAARWNELEDEIKAPYEKIAATEKKKYDELVAEWRIKQAAKKKAQAQAKKEFGEERKSTRGGKGASNLFPSDRSLGSFSDTSNPYPSEWFHSAPEHEAAEREDISSSRSSIPPIVDTTAGHYDKRMAYDHPHSSHHQGWQYARQDPASYYHHSSSIYDDPDAHLRYSSESERTGYYSGQHMYHPPDSSTRGSSSHESTSGGGYRDYFHHSQPPPMYHPHSGRHDARVSRAASLPMSRHDPSQQYSIHRTAVPEDMAHHPADVHLAMEQVGHMRSSRESRHHHRYPYSNRGDAHPRASSMPTVAHPYTSSSSGRRRRPTELMPPPNVEDDAYRMSASAEYGQRMMDPRRLVAAELAPEGLEVGMDVSTPAEPVTVRAPPPGEESAFVPETSLHALNETLDEDAISFITSMKYS
jgi:HMG (high mobility group) box